MRASMLSSFKEFLAGDSVPPLVLNADSEATVDIGTARMSRVSRAKTGYLGAFSFHQDKMSNSSSKLASSSGSFRYSSSSNFTGSELFLSHNKSFNLARISLALLDAYALLDCLLTNQVTNQASVTM
jgi:hypothetical protein